MLAQAPQIQIPSTEQVKSIWDLFVEALKKELGIAPAPAPTAGEEGELLAEKSPVPTGVTVYEGDKNVGVMAIKLRAKKSAITVDRVDLTFNAGDKIVYKYINHVALYDGENAVKGVNLDSTTMERSGNDYKVRLSGLNLKVDKDSEKVITIKVSAAPILTATPTITITVPQNGIRGIDEAGIQQYAPSQAFSGDFRLATAEQGSVEVSLNANSPKEGVVIIDEESDTEITLAMYDIKAKKQNVTLDTVTINVSNTNGVLALRLYDGNTLLQEKTTSTQVTFDSLAISIAKDSTKTLTVKALIAKGTNGEDYKATLASVSGVDANDNSVLVSGTPREGETQHAYTKAPVISNVTVSADPKDLNGTGGAESIVAKITFSVTAKGGDIWISKNANDLAVKAQPSSGSDENVSNVILTTSVTPGNWGYKVAKDQTVTFTVDATHDPSATTSGYWRIAITQIKWNTADNGTGATTWTADWVVGALKTGYVFLTDN